MKALRVLYHMVRADFLERIRRTSFLVTLAAALYLAYAVATEKIWIVVGDGYRGIYNSAWIGMLMTICSSTFLTLVGFYIVKNSIQRDAETRVGRILAATPMRKQLYTLAKAFSNSAVLGCMVFIVMLAALAMQFLRPEARPISLWHLWSPFLFIALPAMFVTGSLAVLFETLPVLRSGVGNVFYFFFWTAFIALGVGGNREDPMGMRLLMHTTRAALQALHPGVPVNSAFSLTIGGERAVRTFLWPGIAWDAHLILLRLLWVAIALAIALLASLFFHRFDPARDWRRKRQSSPPSGLSPETTTIPAEAGISPQPAFSSLPQSTIQLTAIPKSTAAHRFPQLVLCELRLMLKGQRWWWYTIAAGLLIGQLAAPSHPTRSGVLLVAWIWPILLWSSMGNRESRHSTGSLLFSSPRPLTRQLPALWTAGVIVTALTGAGAALRLALSADWQALAGWITAVIFIPSLALALGAVSGSSKPFEALYTAWWYLGPAHQTRGLDFMALTVHSATPAIYAAAVAALIAITFAARRSRLAYA